MKLLYTHSLAFGQPYCIELSSLVEARDVAVMLLNFSTHLGEQNVCHYPKPRVEIEGNRELTNQLAEMISRHDSAGGLDCQLDWCKKNMERTGLRLARNPQIGSGCPNWLYPVESELQALQYTHIIDLFELHLLGTGVRPDYCNASTCEEFDHEERSWYDFFDEEKSMEWSEISRSYEPDLSINYVKPAGI